MNEYIITRRDSNADGGQRLSSVLMGIVRASSHREAVAIAHEKFVRNAYQWIEADNIKYTKRAKANAARRMSR